MSDAYPARERYLDLLAANACGPLSEDEMNELARLRAQFPDVDPDSYDVAAAATVLALTPYDMPPMPESLRHTIESDAPAHLPSKRPVKDVKTSPNAFPVAVKALRRREMLSWLVTAASLLIAIFAWSRSAKAPEGPTEISDSELREKLLVVADDLMRIDWQPGKHPFPDGVEGDVVWSNRRQEGYMRFVGMPVNNPEDFQYQLWIVDPSRDEEPIDGGVFDVISGNEVVVPISAKLRVNSPAAFAITVEQPGGVVVSTQENLPLLAPVPGV